MGKVKGFLECGRKNVGHRGVEERIKDFTAEVELGFDEKTAKKECARCLRCDVKLD